MMRVEERTLEGNHVRLEPLAARHVPELVQAVQDPEVWRYLGAIPHPRTSEDMQRFVAIALAARAQGTELPFAIVERAGGRAVGSTRYMDIRAAHRGLEIGWTWIAPAFQRTAVNTECKLLLLTHAFETLGCIAVEFRTSFFNFASRAAIARLGAKQDGILRSHQILADGTLRDTVVFSIIAPEWPAVKRHLRFELERPRC